MFHGGLLFMKKTLLLSLSLAVFAGLASATTVNCTVTAGTVLNVQQGGTAFTINGGNGTSTGGATGVISCPAVFADPGFTINSYQVLGTADFTSSLTTPIPTTITMLYTLVGGGQNGVTSPLATVTNGPGIGSNGSVPPSPFAIGANLTGNQLAFTVNVTSTVTAGSPSASSGSVGITFTEVATSVPEPTALGLMGSGLLGLGFLARRKKQY
jgi:hypothetical protein